MIDAFSRQCFYHKNEMPFTISNHHLKTESLKMSEIITSSKAIYTGNNLGEWMIHFDLVDAEDIFYHAGCTDLIDLLVILEDAILKEMMQARILSAIFNRIVSSKEKTLLFLLMNLKRNHLTDCGGQSLRKHLQSLVADQKYGIAKTKRIKRGRAGSI